MRTNFTFLCQGQSTMAPRAETMWPCVVPWRVACELVSVIGCHTRPGQHSQPTLTDGVKGVCVFRCNLPTALLAEWPGSFTCHCGNTGWNGHPIGITTESSLWRRKFSHRSCRDSNSQYLDHESDALTNKLYSYVALTKEISAENAQTSCYVWFQSCTSNVVLSLLFWTMAVIIVVEVSSQASLRCVL